MMSHCIMCSCKDTSPLLTKFKPTSFRQSVCSLRSMAPMDYRVYRGRQLFTIPSHRSNTYPAILIVMLQMRLYVLYKRSNKFLASLAVCFLAKVVGLLVVYINFSSTVRGSPKAFYVYFWECLMMSDSCKSSTRSLRLHFSTVWHAMALCEPLPDPCLRVDLM